MRLWRAWQTLVARLVFSMNWCCLALMPCLVWLSPVERRIFVFVVGGSRCRPVCAGQAGVCCSLCESTWGSGCTSGLSPRRSEFLLNKSHTLVRLWVVCLIAGLTHALWMWPVG